MIYITLLRGINIGGKNKVPMDRLKKMFSSMGYDNVDTYINSGNVIFDSDSDLEAVQNNVALNFEREFGFSVPILIMLQTDIIRIAKTIPRDWQNDSYQKTDVAYLFPKIDNEEIIDKLPLNRAVIDVRYSGGAVIWNVERKNQNKSRLSKLSGNKLYQLMTVRNVNTARFLASWKL